jgi:molybdate transport system substrate-binding protein
MRRRLLLCLLVPLLLLAAACGSDSKEPAGAAGGKPTVLAAASLTESFDELGGATFTYAGSSALVTQIQQGAPADVFASADEKNMQQLVDAGLVEEPVVFARNTLAIITKPGNPKGITGLADLAEDGLAVVFADPAVPVGNYGNQALAKAGVTVKPTSLEVDVKAVVTRVTIGDADAGIVYVSDAAAAGDEVDVVDIPEAQNVIATYPIAVVKAAPHHESAEAFIERVLSDDGQAALEEHGFLPAS